MAVNRPSYSDAGLRFLMTEISGGLTSAAVAEDKSREAARMRVRARYSYDWVVRFFTCAALTQKEREQALAALDNLKQRLQALGERF
jgi:hypothetical protein